MTNNTTPDLRTALIEARDWFESQAKAVSKGCGSSYELHDLRTQRDALDKALAAPAQAVDECPHGSKHIVHDCMRCGAPVCCGKCCAEDAQAQDAAAIATVICRAVAELPDRNSPADWPEAMLVTHDELTDIVCAAVASPDPTTPQFLVSDLLRAALRETEACLEMGDVFPGLLKVVKRALAAPAQAAPITCKSEQKRLAALWGFAPATPVQAGEYPELPEAMFAKDVASFDPVYLPDDMHAYADATCAARGTAHADFMESVGLMLAAVGYTEQYARQWPKEKVSITFKRWFDEQLMAARGAAQAAPIEVTDEMALAFHHAISDSSIGQDDVDDTKTGLRAALANFTLCAQAAPVDAAVQALIDSAPAPFRRLGELLASTLDEDQWATAQSLLLGGLVAVQEGRDIQGDIDHYNENMG